MTDLLYVSLWVTITHALLYATVTGVLLISHREFALFNLSAGVWVVLGGWAASTFASVFTAGDVPVNTGWLILALTLGLGQTATPLVLRERISNPLLYMTGTIGFAIVTMSLGSNFVLAHAGATIPFGYSSIVTTTFFAVTIAILLGVSRLTTSIRWANAVFAFRYGKKFAAWRGLSLLLLLEWLLLLLVGACSYSVHKGVFGQAELITIIPVLSLLATNSHRWHAPLLAFALAFAPHAVELGVIWGSGNGGLQSSNLVAYTIVAFLALIVIGQRDRFRLSSRRNQWLPQICNAPQLQRLRGNLVFALLSVALVPVAVAMLSPQLKYACFETIWVLGCASLSFVAMRYLGVLSIAWPSIGGTFVYAYVVCGNTALFWVIVAPALAMSWCFYLWTLRVITLQFAMLIDLASVVALHAFALSTPRVTGLFEQAEVVVLAGIRARHWVLLVGELVVVYGMFGAAYLGASRSRMRQYALALVNPSYGESNGVSVVQVFFYCATLLVAAAALLALCYFGQVGTITPSSSLSVLVGISAMLIGVCFNRFPALETVIGVFVAYFVLRTVALGGPLHEIVIGLAFVMLVFLVPKRVGVDA